MCGFFKAYNDQNIKQIKNVLLLVTRSLTFQPVELSLLWLLPSRAKVRFTQHNKNNIFNLTQFIE